MASIRHCRRSKRSSIRKGPAGCCPSPRTNQQQRRFQSNDSRGSKALFELAGLENAASATFAGVLLLAFLAILIKLSAGESTVRESLFESAAGTSESVV